MKNAKNQNKKCYVFVGQNASTGNPHPVTGRMSFYGEFIEFKSLRDARVFADEIYHDGRYTSQDIISVGGKRKMRQFNLGATMRQFEENLLHAPFAYKNDAGRWMW